jgi:hypothetical protein
MATTITYKSSEFECWVTSTEEPDRDRVTALADLAGKFASTLNAGSYENYRITGLNALVLTDDPEDDDIRLVAIVVLNESGFHVKDQRAWQARRDAFAADVHRELDAAGVTTVIDGDPHEACGEESTFTVLGEYLEKRNADMSV